MSHKILAFLFLVLATCRLSAQPPVKPQYGNWGFDLAGADRSTKPGNEFFRFANGTWIDYTQIPADKPGYSLRLAMSDTTEERLHSLLESLGAKPETDPATLEAKA